MKRINPNEIYCQNLGWFDRSDIVHPVELREGMEVCIAPLDTICRHLWGQKGILQKVQRTKLKNWGMSPYDNPEYEQVTVWIFRGQHGHVVQNVTASQLIDTNDIKKGTP